MTMLDPRTIQPFFLHEQGLLGNELFAIGGCKMSSNASKEWSGTLKEFAEKRDKLQRQIRHHIKEQKRLDKNEPSEQNRAKRLQQTIETLNSASEKRGTATVVDPQQHSV